MTLFKDVNDGALYKSSLIEADQENSEAYHMMIMLNTDGAPVFKSQIFNLAIIHQHSRIGMKQMVI